VDARKAAVGRQRIPDIAYADPSGHTCEWSRSVPLRPTLTASVDHRVHELIIARHVPVADAVEGRHDWIGEEVGYLHQQPLQR
jgi:hypothetical protein